MFLYLFEFKIESKYLLLDVNSLCVVFCVGEKNNKLNKFIIVD